MLIICLNDFVIWSGLGDCLALDRGRHHRRRRLADRTPLAADLHVGDHVVVDVDVDDDLVAAERVEALGPRAGGLSSSPRFRGVR